ncbi:MAG TPA: hypothetical protein VMF67_16730, partial [Rhizomicrobium sp.]|nr:hypothetical protein [Rhizomicrobium sp.]
MMIDVNDASDKEILNFVFEADEEAFREGLAPKQRSLHVIAKVMKRLGYVGHTLAGAGTPPIGGKIAALHSSLYRKSDLEIGGVHGGIFMFRDVF